MIPKRLMCVVLTATLIAVSSTSTFAVETYDSPKDLIEALVTTAYSNDFTLSEITVDDTAVSLNGEMLGYWVDRGIYSDASKSHIILSSTGSSFTASPTALKAIMSDVNSHITETIMPTSKDWNELIGSYDVVFGGSIVAADSWHELSTGDALPTDRTFAFYGIDSAGELYLETEFPTAYTEMPALSSLNFVSADNFSIALIDTSSIVSSGIVVTDITLTESPTTQKTVAGDKQLEAKIASIPSTGMMTVTSTGWTAQSSMAVKDKGKIILTNAGDSADVGGTVTFEEMNFKVIVPASLPMTADPNGNVTTANNAVIINESNAPVQITKLEIKENSSSGWTMVNGTPSSTRGANEFTFATSLNVGDVIEQGEELPFTYKANISPAAEDTTTADIVTLTLTIDWEG